ncbi:Hypothetical predicted protein [Mytilus galloprovincialis]|uniref:ZMYM2-like/QRICH1 C-terminal domain-containing protein n=1 Tax=Mytilus galloprovincialis TaxID=29158 RepID=A0A8B6C321_MYTGA|nr:Hypothetical predicted protein [Mytilus galloprovincialis]
MTSISVYLFCFCFINFSFTLAEGRHKRQAINLTELDITSVRSIDKEARKQLMFLIADRLNDTVVTQSDLAGTCQSKLNNTIDGCTTCKTDICANNCQKERRARPISDNLPIPVEAITQSVTEMELCIRDTALQYFLADAKKTDGNDYPSASLYQWFVAIRGQIRLSDPAVNLLTQPTYVKCRKVLDSMMKKRSAEGLGVASRRRAEPMSSLEENILWERAVIGSDNPPKLLDTMVYLNGLHFALRGGKEHRNLSPKDKVDAFYFKPLVNFTTDQWFCKVPVGHNTLQKTVKRLCTAVRLGRQANKPQIKGFDSNKTIPSRS